MLFERTIGEDPASIFKPAFDGLESTEEDQIKPPNNTEIDIRNPLNIISLGSSHTPPIIVKIRIDIERNAERIQKKQNALILNSIIPIRRKLKLTMPIEIRKSPHQVCLTESFFLSTSPGNRGNIASSSSVK